MLDCVTNTPDNADLVGLQSEVERYKLENERLLKDVKKMYKSKDSALRGPNADRRDRGAGGATTPAL